MEYLPGYAIDEIFITDEGMLTLCDMLSLIPLDTWPESEEDIKWLLFCFGASDTNLS
ncbi:hypothetical protein ACTNC1_05300 [Atopobiaceae bacterium HCP3S3_A4]